MRFKSFKQITYCFPLFYSEIQFLYLGIYFWPISLSMISFHCSKTRQKCLATFLFFFNKINISLCMHFLSFGGKIFWQSFFYFTFSCWHLYFSLWLYIILFLINNVGDGIFLVFHSSTFLYFSFRLPLSIFSFRIHLLISLLLYFVPLSEFLHFSFRLPFYKWHKLSPCKYSTVTWEASKLCIGTGEWHDLLAPRLANSFDWLLSRLFRFIGMQNKSDKSRTSRIMAFLFLAYLFPHFFLFICKDCCMSSVIFSLPSK